MARSSRAEPWEAGAALDVHARPMLPARHAARTVAKVAPHTVSPRLPSQCAGCAGAGVGLEALSITSVLEQEHQSDESAEGPWHRLFLGHRDCGQTSVTPATRLWRGYLKPRSSLLPVCSI